MQHTTNHKTELVSVSPCYNNIITHTAFYVHWSNNSHCTITTLTYHHRWQFEEAKMRRFIGFP